MEFDEEKMKAEVARLKGVRNEVAHKLLLPDGEWRDLNAQIVRLEWVLGGGFAFDEPEPPADPLPSEPEDGDS